MAPNSNVLLPEILRTRPNTDRKVCFLDLQSSSYEVFSWRRSSLSLEALQGSLFDTRNKICISRPWAGCRHTLDGIGVYYRVQKGTSLGRPMGRDREHTSDPAAEGLCCLPATYRALKAELCDEDSRPRSLSDPEGSSGSWTSLLSKREVCSFCVPRRPTLDMETMWCGSDCSSPLIMATCL